MGVQFLREVENRGLGDCSTLGIKNARDWTSAGVCGHADQAGQVAQGLADRGVAIWQAN